MVEDRGPSGCSRRLARDIQIFNSLLRELGFELEGIFPPSCRIGKARLLSLECSLSAKGEIACIRRRCSVAQELDAEALAVRVGTST